LLLIFAQTHPAHAAFQSTSAFHSSQEIGLHFASMPLLLQLLKPGGASA
jgi:hypothetical protein